MNTEEALKQERGKEKMKDRTTEDDKWSHQAQRQDASEHVCENIGALRDELKGWCNCVLRAASWSVLTGSES